MLGSLYLGKAPEFLLALGVAAVKREDSLDIPKSRTLNLKP